MNTVLDNRFQTTGFVRVSTLIFYHICCLEQKNEEEDMTHIGKRLCKNRIM